MPTESKPLSAERRRQLRVTEEGRCLTSGCPHPPSVGGHCAACREVKGAAARNRYRLKKGIPLDAPLTRRGRRKLSQSPWTNTDSLLGQFPDLDIAAALGVTSVAVAKRRTGKGIPSCRERLKAELQARLIELGLKQPDEDRNPTESGVASSQPEGC